VNHLIVQLAAFSVLVVGCAAEADMPAEDSTPVELLTADLDPPLIAAKAIQDEGGTFDLAMLRALYTYGRAQPDDARPWLLLARDAMRTEQPGFAVRYYSMAIDADPRAAREPGVLEDVLAIARDHAGQERVEALDLLQRAFGRDAAPAMGASAHGADEASHGGSRAAR
jgi:hypothetical protein